MGLETIWQTFQFLIHRSGERNGRFVAPTSSTTGPTGRSRRSLRPPLPAASAPFLWAATAVAVGHDASGHFAGERAVENALICLRCFRICLQRRKWPWRRLGKLLHLRCLVDCDASRLAAWSLSSLLSIPIPGTSLSCLCSERSLLQLCGFAAFRLRTAVTSAKALRYRSTPAMET